MIPVPDPFPFYALATGGAIPHASQACAFEFCGHCPTMGKHAQEAAPAGTGVLYLRHVGVIAGGA